MVKLLGRIPRTINVAVSGGADSMICLDFIRGVSLPSNVQKEKARKVLVLHFDHGTEHGAEARHFVESFCVNNNLPCITGSLTRDIRRGESKEAFWREQRYSFFESWHIPEVGKIVVPFDKKDFIERDIITCHHLDDQVENWIFSSLHGKPKLIPYRRGRYIRPFLLSSKEDLLNFRNRLPFDAQTTWIKDPSNSDTSYMRNFIRHKLLPQALFVNPGLSKVVKKNVIAEYEVNIKNYS